MPENRNREYLFWAMLFAVFAFLAFAYAAATVFAGHDSIFQPDLGWALVVGFANTVGLIIAMRRRHNILVDKETRAMDHAVGKERPL